MKIKYEANCQTKPLFDTEEECLQYEKEVEFLASIEQICDGFSVIPLDVILRWVDQNSEAVLKYLSPPLNVPLNDNLNPSNSREIENGVNKAVGLKVGQIVQLNGYYDDRYIIGELGDGECTVRRIESGSPYFPVANELIIVINEILFQSVSVGDQVKMDGCLKWLDISEIETSKKRVKVGNRLIADRWVSWDNINQWVSNG